MVNYKAINKELIDYETGVTRCLGDEQLYKQILSMFLDDDTFSRAKSAYDVSDYKKLFDCTHELKGISGNASLVRLFDDVCTIVEYLRLGDSDKGTVDRMLKDVETAYSLTRQEILDVVLKV